MKQPCRRNHKIPLRHRIALSTGNLTLNKYIPWRVLGELGGAKSK
jgi:hypothetical protein